VTEPPEWRARLERVSDCVLPWIQDAVPLAGRRVLEYGSGQGPIACALAPHTGRYVGIDIAAGEVAMAREHVARRGLDNVEFQVAAEEEILDVVGSMRGEVDVFLLYAVLEHMSIDERLAILRLAREVVAEDGVIVIGEAPNRLTPIDHHTGQMPFLHALPLELAEQSYRRSAREDFVAAIDAAAADGREAARQALIRWGRGMSFHELDLVFDDLAAHTLASSYAAPLYPARAVRVEELHLAALLEAWRPELPPCWSRSWLDLILTPRPLAEPPQHVRPWQLRLDHDVPGAAVLADGRVELRPGARLRAQLPAPTSEVHVGVMAVAPQHAVRVHAAGHELAPEAHPNLDRNPQWHACAVLPEPAGTIEVQLPEGGCITYVGFRGPPDPEASHRRPAGW
jgi:SAM-dependent methyltransferase